MSDRGLSLGPRAARLQRVAFLVGAAGLGLCALGALCGPLFAESATSSLFGHVPFFRAYLVAWLGVLALPLGSLAILMVYHLTGGAWGAALRGVLEAATRTLPLVAILFVPLLLGLNDLYPWTQWDPEELKGTILAQKQQYLNIPAFIVRAAIYFAVWLGLAFVLNRRTNREQETSRITLQRMSGPGLVLLSLTVTFAAIDWMMSLEPFWNSTIFGMLVAAGQVLAAFAFGIIALVVFSEEPATNPGESVPHGSLQDLGSLLLTFVMLWAYLAFSQYLLIWSGDLPEEIPWYLKRLQGGWEFVGLLLILLHFVLPFFVLLSRDVKRNGRTLAVVAGVILVMRFVDLYWMIVPAYPPHDGFRLHWMDAAALAGLGGLWLALFLRQMEGRPHE